METIFKKVSELIENNEYCPLPLEVIPNNMGINLCSVDAISWQKQSDGQLANLTIHFLPEKENLGVSNLPITLEKLENCINDLRIHFLSEERDK